MMGALTGIRIIDTTEGAQGPWAAALLGDLGADVIKVEKPEGEMMRHSGPFKNGNALPMAGMNHGKRNIVLNLKNDEDREILLRLADTADVFLENWRPGVADRLGVDYATLTARNPRLIYASASGFGQSGPYARKAAVDQISQAMGGYLSLTGPAGGPGERPRFIVIDFTSPLTAVQGVLLALIAREENGAGQWVQCSQLETMISIGSVRAQEYFLTGQAPGPWGSGSAYCVPSQAFRTADSYILVDCPTPATWRALCETLGLAALADDPRYATNAARVEHREELITTLAKAFLRYRGERWLAKLAAAGVPCSAVAWDIEDLYDDPQVVANGLIVEREADTMGRIRTNAVPWLLSATPATYGPLAAPMDADRESVLAELRAAAAVPAD